MRTVRVILVCSLAAGLAGCAADAFPWTKAALRGAIIAPEEAERMRLAAANKLTAELLDAKAGAKLPTTLALAKLYNQGGGFETGLSLIEAEEMTRWEQTVANHPKLAGIQPIPSLVLRPERDGPAVTLRSLREASARIGSELLVVYLQNDRTEEHTNAASALYWTVLGLWLAPGHELRAETTMQGIVVDCRTGKILGSAISKAREEKTCAAMAVDDQRRRITKEAESQARKDLHTRIGQVLSRVTAQPLAAAR